MGLMLLAEDDLPISMEQQESIISFFSVASSALLLVIIGGAGERIDKDCPVFVPVVFVLYPW